MIRYSPSHEWVRFDGKKATVGITQHASTELGEIVFIELPKPGTIIRLSEETCVLESTKAAADIYAPMSGKITEVNEALKTNPSLINRSPEKEGWLYRIEIAKPQEADHLLTEEQYNELVEK